MFEDFLQVISQRYARNGVNPRKEPLPRHYKEPVETSGTFVFIFGSRDHREFFFMREIQLLQILDKIALNVALK